VGEGRQQRFGQRSGAGLRLALSKNVQTDKSQATGLPLASKQTQCARLGCQNLEPTCAHALGFPICPLPEAKGEDAYGACLVEWFAEEAKRIKGVTLPQFDRSLQVTCPLLQNLPSSLSRQVFLIGQHG
jgi:hypothetical protein